MITDIRYILETNELEITDYYGYPTYVDMSTLEPVDANERELGVELEYVVNKKLHVFFYPEGVLCDWYEY